MPAMSRPVRPLLLLLGALLAACQAAPPAGALRTLPAPVLAGARPPAARAGALQGRVLAPPGIVASNSARLVSNNGGAVLANGGASLVANNGAGLISKAKYGLRALATTPLAGATVRVLDATGRPVAGPDGAPLVATTDADGRFAFDASLPAGNVVLDVGVSSGTGAADEALRAIAPPAPAPAAAREVAIDVPSTLVAGYVLDRLVRAQPDPQRTLDRLDPALEAETRAHARSALEASGVGLGAYTAPSVLTAVESLRRSSRAFDDQLAAVRRRLVVAGQLDLGAGRPALDVVLGYTDMLAARPDGSLLIACSRDRRIWSLRPDGTLVTFAGTGTPSYDVAGLLAPSAGLLTLYGFDFDDRGRLVLLEGDAKDDPEPRLRLSRIGPDGRVEVLWEGWRGRGTPGAFFAGPGDTYWMLLSPDDEEDDVRLWRVEPGQPARSVAGFDAEESRIAWSTYAAGRDAAGRLYLGSSSERPLGAIWRFDPREAFPKLEKVASSADEGLAGLSVDARGNIYRVLSPGGALTVTPPDGPPRELLAAFPKGQRFYLDGATLAPDGSVYIGETQTWSFSAGSRVFRIRDGEIETVAGRPITSDPAAALDTALQGPAATLELPGGDVLVADTLAHRIYRLDPAGRLAVWSGSGEPGHRDGALAEAVFENPEGLAMDASGTIWIREAGKHPRIRRVAPDGRVSTVFTAEGEDPWVGDVVVAPDGTLYYETADRNTRPYFHEARVVRPGQAHRVLFRSPSAPFFAMDRQGRLIYALDGAIYRHAEAGPPDVLSTDLTVDRLWALGVSPDGRLFGVDRLRVYAFDAQGRASILAGRGGKLFDGEGPEGTLHRPFHVGFRANGDMLVADYRNRQIKRIAAGTY